MATDDNYYQFLRFFFDRNESKGEWYFDHVDDVEEPELSDEDTVDCIKRMLDNCKTDLACYSDWQLGTGLRFMFSCWGSQYAFLLRDLPSPIEKRLEAIKSIKILFRDCFNPRAAKTLQIREDSENQLSYICYNFWEVSPFDYCEENDHKELIYPAVADVLAYILTLDNIACVQSGIYGLWLLGLHYYPRAHEIIRQHISAGTFTDERILSYAIMMADDDL